MVAEHLQSRLYQIGMLLLVDIRVLLHCTDYRGKNAHGLLLPFAGLGCTICACATPAFFKSSTEEYGRLETIFFTVAAPTPGNESSSFSDAVFRSILPKTVCCWVWGRLLLSFSLSLRLPLGIAPAVTPN